ncbi:hypothetical protein HMPREF0539_0822 [Lacticaseibacillus rhamnosus LMS2-1]|uniref:Uncharacterized protein n=1 Tax=Lacticaseibacillus rhamnosus (strain LMS2-1) TaxID=525361 RepID=C2JV88_LACRM|nr:hypothetical protein LRHK_2596 [Lacticaseibacillus rhamnosus ATCC 8530]EEN81050.1 hypothetical protein HMPREF0539_0822 [Lacticaseibacillus rhamnosus LMS2-1]
MGFQAFSSAYGVYKRLSVQWRKIKKDFRKIIIDLAKDEN